MVEFVKQLASLESPSTVPDTQDSIIDLLRDQLEELGFKCTRMTGDKTGGYLYASPAHRVRNSPIQLLVGHCDTVWPLETLAVMPVASDENRIRGPGVYDMKGGLTQMIYALKVLNEIDENPSVTPVVLINSDEEIGSKESTEIIKRISKISDRAFVLEPSLGIQGSIKTQRKGVGRFTVKIKGKSAHAGLDPGEGTSAIVALSKVIQELFLMNDPEKEISVNVGMIEGGTRPNVVAEESKAVIDVRVPTKQDAQVITKKIHDLKHSQSEVEIEIEGSIGRPPMEATQLNRKLWTKAKQAGELLGVSLEQSFAGGASDGNTTSQYTATLDGLGATGDGAHAAHEFLFVDKMLERTALLVLLLMMDPVTVQDRKK
jgi:glutamate carboxypeptidase